LKFRDESSVMTRRLLIFQTFLPKTTYAEVLLNRVEPMSKLKQLLFPDDLPPAILALADGRVFHGYSLAASGHQVGEVVFNTAMTGYQEILSDPSYAGQLVTLTYPHIGNTGINEADNESSQIQ